MRSVRNKPEATIALIILAAGGSRRMGQPKQLLSVYEESLIKHVTREGLRSLCFPVIVVLGASYDQILSEVQDLPVYLAKNENWEKGISSSIKCGLETLELVYPKAQAAILAVGDQPGVTSGVFNGLGGAFKSSSAKIIASRYNETKGTPALFSKQYFAKLKRLRGDSGARKLFDGEPEGVVKTFDFEQGNIDLDTPEDYFRFSQS